MLPSHSMLAPTWILQILLLAAMPIFAQQPTKPVSAHTFEVASVTPWAGDGMISNAGVNRTADGISGNVSIRDLLRAAYGDARYKMYEQITGLPDWANNDRYLVSAKMTEADTAAFTKLSIAEQNAWIESMLQALLTERFHLAEHASTKQMAVYELLVAKGGFKLQPVDESDPRVAKMHGGNAMMVRGTGKINIPATSLDDLAAILSGLASRDLGRPVVNKTGLPGRYDFVLTWSPMRAAAPQSDANSAADTSPSIFTALQDDFGLRLQPSNAMVDILVVDRVEKPTEN